MLIITTNEIPGKTYEVLGMVKGSVVQTKHLGRDIAAGFKTLMGGEIRGYTEMLIEARNIATERMVNDASRLGADAIIGARYESAAIMQNASEVLAYGTAVKLK